MRTQLRRHGCWAVLLILAACSLLAYGQDADMQVTRAFSTAHAVPGSTFQVALRIKANADLQGVGIREELPLRWTIQPVENAGAAFKRSEAEWVFSETLEAGDSLYIVYEVTVPEAGELLSDPLPQCFSIHGTYQATVPGFETAIEGESEIEIVSCLPIGTAVAHLIPESADAPDTIDLRLSRLIQQEQLERALELWQADLPVPGTGGELLDLATVNHLAAQYETCTPADEALPLSIDPELQAVRVLETNLPCDSVLLPEGCLDPGTSARVVTVTVQITPSYDAYGVGLSEWFPPAWRVTPIRHDGFWYRPSASEWVYPTRVLAGQTIELTYEVEVIGTAIDLLETGIGCCGQEMVIYGEASSALECSVAQVGGESIVTVQRCLPVILAISRWDVFNDQHDAELSNLITFPQVQRAVEFWQNSSPVPHTCGYTVGYHALKTIVAYWLAGLPITSVLPTSVLPDACESSPAACTENGCTDAWLCATTEAQDPEDFVGLPDPPDVFVDGGPDCQLTCARPSVTLSATTQGGVEPFQFEWIGPSGQSLGDRRDLTVTDPGQYTVVATSCGGCMATDTVTVSGDFAAPQLAASVSDVLTGYVTLVDLKVAISGGTAPFAIQWIDPQGALLGTDASVAVSLPGAYQVNVVGANGCSSAATVVVQQDIEPPLVEIEILPSPPLTLSVEGGNAVLTCATPEIQLTGIISGGKDPYELVWIGGDGVIAGEGETLVVTAPGTYELTVTGANGCRASATATVTQDIEAPVLSTSVSDELTCAVGSVLIVAEATGGRPPYVYTWSGPTGEAVGTEAEVTVQEPGTYTVTVTGANGCSTSATVEVLQNIEPPTVATSVSGVLTCDLSEVSLTASASGGRVPFDYTWTNAAGNAVGCTSSIDVSAPGVYTVTVTGANGCSAQAEVTVEQDIEVPVVEATVDGTLSCALPEVNLHVNIVGGRAPLEIEWRNASDAVVGTTALLPVTTAGRYTVRVTGANGCADTASVTVLEDRAAPIVSVEASGDLTCNVSTVELSSTVTGGRTPYVYTWLDPAGDVAGDGPAVDVTVPGTYTLTVAGANGCEATTTVTVLEDIAPPVVLATVSGSLTCAVTEVSLNSLVTGGRMPYEYAWSDSTGTVLGTSGSLAVQVPGTYLLTVTGANGCASNAQVLVTQDIEPPVVAASASGVLTCDTTEVALTSQVVGGRTPYTYVWTDPVGETVGTGDSVSVRAPGTYAVTVTGANGCAAFATVAVVQDIEPPTVTATACGILTCLVTEVCVTSSVSDAQTPSYVWTDAMGTMIGSVSSITVSEPGAYTVTVTNANGCSGCATAVVSQDLSSPEIAVTVSGTLTCASPSVLLTSEISGGQPPYTYVWTNPNGNPIGTHDALSVAVPGAYTLTVTGANGCSNCTSAVVSQDISTPEVVVTASGPLTCACSSTLLMSAVSGGRFPYTYVWTDPNGTPIGTDDTVSVDAPGMYMLTVTGVNGCSHCATVEVVEDIAPPVVLLGETRTLTCAEPAVWIEAVVCSGCVPFTYVWTDQCSARLATTKDLLVNVPGTYTLTVTGANGCIGSSSLQVLDGVDPPIVDAGPDQVLACVGDEVLLNATVTGGLCPYGYVWGNACGEVVGTSEDLVVSTPGVYILTVSTRDGCVGMDSVTVESP